MRRHSHLHAWRCAAIAALALFGFASAPALAAEPQRIVSVGGSVTEILYALGLDDRIAAVDTTSLYPPAATQKPNVGYLRALSAEGVLAVSPDLIIMEAGSGPPEAVSLLDQAGIPVVHVRAGHDAADLAAKIEQIAKAVGREKEGEALAARAQAELAALQRAVAGIEARKRVIFILSLVDGRPMAAGTGTAADAMIRLVGARNALSDMQGYKTISAEAAADLQPDAILIVNRSGETGGGEKALELPAFARTPAAKNGALINMDALSLLGFGPRTPAAARELALSLYPDLAIEGAD